MSAARTMLAPIATPLDEGALVAAACLGDHGAYTALYQRYAVRVHARLTQLVGPTCDREDLVQQVFLELHRALPRFRAESSIGTFIHSITVHVALDHLRRRSRRPSDFTAEELDELIDGSPTRFRHEDRLGDDPAVTRPHAVSPGLDIDLGDRVREAIHELPVRARVRGEPADRVARRLDRRCNAGELARVCPARLGRGSASVAIQRDPPQLTGDVRAGPRLDERAEPVFESKSGKRTTSITISLSRS